MPPSTKTFATTSPWTTDRNRSLAGMLALAALRHWHAFLPHEQTPWKLIGKLFTVTAGEANPETLLPLRADVAALLETLTPLQPTTPDGAYALACGSLELALAATDEWLDLDRCFRLHSTLQS